MKPVAHLADPSRSELEAAYRSLEQPGMITVSCPAASLSAVLETMEAVGFVAMTVNRATLDEADVRVAAAKAKAGPCFDGGRSATYRGAARAALDDDNHLLVGELRVCEKTARVYGLDLYSALVEVTGGDPELLVAIDSNPVDFDCNTYLDDLGRLLADLPETAAPTEDGVALFYPGPFRLLVLADGNLLRRGEATLVAADLAAGLVARDGCVELTGEMVSTAKTASFLPRLVAEQGTGAMLGELPLERLAVPSRALDLAAVDRVSGAFSRRLARVIDHGDPMLVITGSDPRDELGCCPSEELGEALALVEAGVLSAHRSPTAPDACPVTVLAFAGEMEVVGGRPSFSADHELRASVRQRLRVTDEAGDPPQSPTISGRRLLTWLLLAFVILSLGVAAVKVTRTLVASPPPLAEVIGAAETDRLVLCLFHSGRGCPLCSKLEAGARFALDRHLAREIASGELRFMVVDLERPGLEAYKHQHRIFSPSLVLIEVAGGRVVEAQTLNEAWSLADSADDLADHIHGAVRASLDG